MKDTIYREDAIKALYKYSFVSKDVIEKEINAIPSADTDISEYSDRLWKNAYERGKADRPHGEWIEHKWAEEVEGLLISNYECSECHSWERRASDFCPNCGARMKGADDE